MTDVAFFIVVFLFASLLMWAAMTISKKEESLAIVSHVKEGDVWYPVVRFKGQDIVLDSDGIIKIGRIMREAEDRCITLEEKIKAQDERLELMGDAIYKASGIPHPPK